MDTTRLPLGGFSWNLISGVFIENLSRIFEFHSNLTKITGTLHKAQYTFLIISRLVILGIRNISDKIYRENQNTHFMFNNSTPPPPSHAVLKIMWKNIVKSDRPQKTIWRMGIECWITKATDTHSEYVIFIVFFPLHQWLHEWDRVLRYTYIVRECVRTCVRCLV
jgi:hypothetical protein